MTRARFRAAGSDDGAQAVEFALISVPLMLILLGIIQFGFIFYSHITVAQAAREAARALSLDLGTTTPGSCDSSCVSAAEQKAIDSASPGVTLTASNFDVVQSCPAGANQSTEAVIQLHYQVPAAFLFTITIKGKSSMPCGG